MTTEDTRVMYRWDNHVDDREIYDEMFTQAIDMIKVEAEREVGAMIMIVINEWEKNRRSVPMAVINAAYEVTLAHKRRADNAPASMFGKNVWV